MGEEQPTLWEWTTPKHGGQEEGSGRGVLDLSALPAGAVDRREEASRLHRALEQRLGTVDLVLTDNRRRMLSTRRRRHRQQIRAHHMFVGADEQVVDAIADLAAGRPDARQTLRDFVAEHRGAIRQRPARGSLRVSGEHFQLDEVLTKARALLEGHALGDIQITWGRRGSGSKSIRLGSFDFERRLVRVHPALDRAWVPSYFVEFIVYHELVHAVCPPKVVASRRKVHTREFRALERRFPRYREAVAWEQKNLSRLLSRA